MVFGVEFKQRKMNLTFISLTQFINNVGTIKILKILAAKYFFLFTLDYK